MLLSVVGGSRGQQEEEEESLKKSSQPSTAEELVLSLRERNEQVRQSAAQQLRAVVAFVAVKEELLTKLMNELCPKLFVLMQSVEEAHQLGGLEALDQLIHIKSNQEETKTIRFANYLRNFFGQTTITTEPALRKAAQALGHLARAGGTSGPLNAALVDFEAKRALEWLVLEQQQQQNQQLHHHHQQQQKGGGSAAALFTQRRLAACLVLKELAEHAPTLFHANIPPFFDSIWIAVRDTQCRIREAATAAISVCLKHIAQRQTRHRVQWYCKIYEQVRSGFARNTPEAIHGSLLVIGELLKKENTGQFMVPRFKEVCDNVLKYKNYKDKLVKRSVCVLLPQLAKFCPDAFVRHYLHTCLDYLMQSSSSNSKTKELETLGVSYLALGELCLAVRPPASDASGLLVESPIVESILSPKLENLVELIKEGLGIVVESKKKKKISISIEVLKCMANLAKAMGEKLAPYMDELVDQMMNGGLNEALIGALSEIVTCIPSYAMPVQERLINQLSFVLSGERIIPSSIDSPFQIKRRSHAYATMSKKKKMTKNSFNSLAMWKEEKSLILSLKTLGEFNFSREGFCLLAFVRDCVSSYLEDKEVLVRQQAVLTCSQLLCLPEKSRSSQKSVVLVGQLLSKLLRVGISDPEMRLRKCVIDCFLNETKFDSCLCQVEYTNRLFLVLNDENFDIRLSGLKLIGRLARWNPAVILPNLRCFLVALLTQLNVKKTKRKVDMLAILIRSVSCHAALLTPYVTPILRLIIPLLKDDNLASSALVVIGELSCAVNGTLEIAQYQETLLPLILETLQDHANMSKRQQALKTLGQVVQSTGSVVSPYLRFPRLLDLLLKFLDHGESFSWGIRREAMKTIGILGALDPYQQKLSKHPDILYQQQRFDSPPPTSSHEEIEKVDATEEKVEEEVEEEDEVILPCATSEDYCPTVAVSALMRILKEPSLSLHHHGVIQGVMFIFKSVGLRGVPFLSRILPSFLEVMHHSNDSRLRESLFLQLATLVKIVKRHMRVFLPDILLLIRTFWYVHLPQILVLLQEIAAAVPDELHRVYMPQLIPLLLDALEPQYNRKKERNKQAQVDGKQINLAETRDKTSTSKEKGEKEEMVLMRQNLSTLLSFDKRKITTTTTTTSNRRSGSKKSPQLSPSRSPSPSSSSTSTSTSRTTTTTRGGGGQDMVFDVVVQIQVVSSLMLFGSALQEYLSLLIPSLMLLLEAENTSLTLRFAVLDTLSQLACRLQFGVLAGRIMHPIARLLRKMAHATPQDFLLNGISSTNNVSSNSNSSSTNSNNSNNINANSSNDEKKNSFDRSLKDKVAAFGGNLLEANEVAILRLICVLLYQLQEHILAYKPMLDKALDQIVLDHPVQTGNEKSVLMEIYTICTTEMQQGKKNVTLSSMRAIYSSRCRTIRWFDFGESSIHSSNPTPTQEPSTSSSSLYVNQPNLQRAWETSQRSTREDWLEWMRRFSIELLRESPSPALRSCASLAQVYPPLARELFNAAFVSCWNELYEQYQDYLVRALETAFQSACVPAEILTVLLNLAEFMEHDVEALPIDIRQLGTLAEKCHAYAKALHYKELEFHTSPATCIEALISINNQLGQPEAAVGILKYAQQHHANVISVKERWYEKLRNWSEALKLYQKKKVEQDEEEELEVVLGKMRCLTALGDWESLVNLTQQIYRRLPSFEEKKWIKYRPHLALLAARACWALGQWPLMEKYVEDSDPKLVECSLYKSILLVHEGVDFERAYEQINKTRESLDSVLSSLVSSESYSRVYNPLVTLQQLTELEEILVYKQKVGRPQHQHSYKRHLIGMWQKRLSGCTRSVEVWQQLLSVRSLLLKPVEDVETWLQFASLARQAGSLQLSLKVFTQALKKPPQELLLQNINTTTIGNRNDHNITFAYLKHLWVSGETTTALSHLQQLITTLSQSPSSHLIQEEEKKKKLLVSCHLKWADWRHSLSEEEDQDKVLWSLQKATQLDPHSYKAWHNWALMNFRVVEFVRTDEQKIKSHVAPAVEAFFSSISLGRSRNRNRWTANVQQDILRLLTLWFRYGHLEDVSVALNAGFQTLSIETWLLVIPQLIARIHTPHPVIKQQLHRLLITIGREHPQALIYPLSVALKSPLLVRKQAAETIMATMRTRDNLLVEQALLVSRELIRVAILWHEMWHEGLEEASRLYFGEHHIEGMIEVLEPLHQMMQKGPETLREVSFQQQYGRELHEAYQWIQRYLHNNSGNTSTSTTTSESELNRAWDLYYHVFRRINKQLPQLTTLELQYVSPALLEAKNLCLAVPGTYGEGSIRSIQNFRATVHVITSKQRPRKVAMLDNCGREWTFLLKGHEDLRQDERVMQLFGLVNALLQNDYSTTSKRDLQIERYAVIPLSHNAGIVGWVPNCDTLHQLIRDYRETRKILLNIEHRLMLQMAPDYDSLSLIQKVEVFEYALENTAGQDLYKVLWLKSENSEVWLDRRTNYTRSLGVMSMVGYILGLGDRHPSNLMLDRFTGTIVHIDFGDCFEVAMHREKYPEKIPFRLTRMLTNAMEVSGIEGNFRSTCVSVMAVLRENRDSLMAMLEAFVHDPLINWRLLAAAANASPTAATIATPATTTPPNLHRTVSEALQETVVPGQPPTISSTPGTASQQKHLEVEENIQQEQVESHLQGEIRAEEENHVHSEEIKDQGDQRRFSTTSSSYSSYNSSFYDYDSVSSSSAVAQSLPPTLQHVRFNSSTKRVTSDEFSSLVGEESAVIQEEDEDLLDDTPIEEDLIAGSDQEEKEEINEMEDQFVTSSNMNISQSIPIGRGIAKRFRKTGNINLEEGRDDEEDEYVRPGHQSLHIHMSTLAASVTNAGHGSLQLAFQKSHLKEQSLQGSAALSGEKSPETKEIEEDEEKDQQEQEEEVKKPTSVVNNRSHRERELVHILGPEGAAAPREALNEKALSVIRRVQAKLTGRDFADSLSQNEQLDVENQVQRLITQAASHENLCQCYIGWCPFW